ncbi:hypothetical protein Angca_000984, partial [Angiostrongylus cantonensis]
KETTKLRIIRDASTRLKKVSSLNDVLREYPVLLLQICDIIPRFCFAYIARVIDLEKTFLQ